MGTLDIYRQLQEKLVATPARAHCTFSLYDLSRVFAGVSLLSAPRGVGVSASQSAAISVVRLWCHEVVRCFADRLLTTEGDLTLNSVIAVNS